MEFDFSGWATKNDLKCSDGRTIRRDAFKDCDGMTVPLVWNHQHNSPDNVLGHALLENREDGVYAYGVFNKTEAGMNAKEMVRNGDIKALSIYANQLRQNGSNVVHGAIREVSLVLAGANPGAWIDVVLEHSDDYDGEAILCYDESLEHSEEVAEHSEEKVEAEEAVVEHAEAESKPEEKADTKKEDSKENVKDNRTVGDVFDTFNEEQKKVCYAMIALALQGKESDEKESKKDEGETSMKHNVFDADETKAEEVLSHSDMMAIIDDAKRYGSMKESALQHGVTSIETLFPDDHNVNNVPGFINLYGGTWVNKVMTGVHHSPFSRLKSIYADISEDDARAKGYLADHTHRDAKGNLVDADGNPVKKKEEVFSLLKRTTSPTTVYKKQKLDRDDVVDITDFDVVSWIKGEMRVKLDEELARAFLIGDGRLASSDDKINESNIRPIWTDDTLYTINQVIEVASTATAEDKANALIDNAILGRVKYKGAGNPTLFTTEMMLANMLLIKDVNGRRIYNNESDLATAMRVKEIVTVPYFEGLTRTVDSKTRTLGGIIVNLADYTVGADKGGAVNLFDDFDIDYNAQKYLIETRCSGSLLVPYSAIALEFVPQA